MSETTTTLETRIQVACDIAAGKVEADPSSTGHRVRGGHKDLNCKGKGPWWFRMVWRGGRWQYFSEERLPAGTFRAHERRATVYGDVYVGEITVTHDRGGPLDEGAELVCPPDEQGRVMVAIPWKARRDGNLVFTLPDGGEVVTPNPRAK